MLRKTIFLAASAPTGAGGSGGWSGGWMMNGNENTPQYLATLSSSQQVVAKLQQLYGSMRPDSLQVLRKRFYSFQTYGTGNTIFNFFGAAVGNAGQTQQDTNMPLAGTFGTSAMLVKSVEVMMQVDYSNEAAFTGTDATTLAAEYLAGLVQAGVFYLTINGKQYIEILKPFLYAPPADGALKEFTAGHEAAQVDRLPYVDQARRGEALWVQDPEIFIEAQTNFSAQIRYDSGAIAPIITGLTSGPATPTVIRVGVRLDGLQFRPTQ